MRPREYRYFVGDFETTVYDGQTDTEVWASACVELNTEDVKIFHSIKEQYEYFLSLDCNLICHYHNLKFDGNFWLSFLMTKLYMPLAFDYSNEEHSEGSWHKVEDMKNDTFKCIISDKGMWYSITIMHKGHVIEFRDSLKLLPFSVKRIGESFGTKHKKLDMEYTGYRYAGCEITEEEQRYIANDVLVVKEAIEIMFNDGHNKLTIGSCCMEEFKHTIDKQDWKKFFPDLTAIELNKEVHKYPNVDKWLRKSYKGGWCYLVKGKEDQIKYNGTTADVNSLYPSMMSSESGNKYPIGEPKFWIGNEIPDEAIGSNKYFFVRIKTRFRIKEGYLPFIQVKGNLLYDGTVALESSDVYNKKDGKYYSEYYDSHGNKCDTKLELTLTMTDYYLFLEHYHVYDFEIIDGCYFYTITGLFDEYIDKWAEVKKKNKGAKREEAKLFLNNLYGKMASSTDSSFKLPFVMENGSIGFYSVVANDKKAGYIAIGSAITSYARNFTIRAAQKNYHGTNERGFIYADTDSIHCDLLPEEIVGIKVHDKNFCCWKLESCWDFGIFARQKTYIEHVTHEDLVPIEEIMDNEGKPRKQYYNVKCAGMPNKCKDLFLKSFEEVSEEELQQYTEEEQEFLKTRRTIEDFKIGLKIPGKLMPKRISGGVLLVDTSYEMR